MHRLSALRPRCGRLLLLVTAALVAAAAVAAAPAAADPTPTNLTVTAQSQTVNWGATAVLNGMLRTAAEPVQAGGPAAGARRVLASPPPARGPWRIRSPTPPHRTPPAPTPTAGRRSAATTGA